MWHGECLRRLELPTRRLTVRRLLILSCAAVAAVSASCQCGDTATFSCRRDSDCTTGHICINGECLTGTRTSDGGYVLDGGHQQGGQDSGQQQGQDSGQQQG